MDKRGTIDDKIYFLYIFAGMVIIIGAVTLMWTPVYNTLYNLGNSTHPALDNITPTSVYGWVDWCAVFFYFAINILICIVLPFYVENNPIYIALLFVFSFLYAFIAAIIANALIEFLTDIGSPYTHLNFILDNFVIFEVVFLLIMGVVLYVKHRGGSNEIYIP